MNFASIDFLAGAVTGALLLLVLLFAADRLAYHLARKHRR
jgi:hypothetical protein